MFVVDRVSSAWIYDDNSMRFKTHWASGEITWEPLEAVFDCAAFDAFVHELVADNMADAAD